MFVWTYRQGWPEMLPNLWAWSFLVQQEYAHNRSLRTSVLR